MRPRILCDIQMNPFWVFDVSFSIELMPPKLEGVWARNCIVVKLRLLQFMTEGDQGVVDDRYEPVNRGTWQTTSQSLQKVGERGDWLVRGSVWCNLGCTKTTART